MYRFLAILVVLVVATSAPTQGYRYNYYTYSQPACYPYYGSQVSYPSTVTPGTYQSQHHHYEKTYPAQKVVAQEIAVAPLIVTVPVESKAVPVHAYGSPYYYSV